MEAMVCIQDNFKGANFIKTLICTDDKVLHELYEVSKLYSLTIMTSKTKSMDFQLHYSVTCTRGQKNTIHSGYSDITYPKQKRK